MGVTITDVARHAGVSHTTVSWVIHDDPRITSETKEKVWKSIRELDYHPNIQARSLVRGKTDVIAVVASTFSTAFEMTFLRGMEKAVSEDLISHSINLFSTYQNPERKNKLLREILHGKRADAVILVNLPLPEDIRAKYLQHNVPIILVEHEAPDVHVFKMDGHAGAYAAVDHLIRQGRRHIALVNGIVNTDEGGVSPKERLDGYSQALLDHGIEFREELVCEIDEYYFEFGEHALHVLNERNTEIDAVFCAAGDMVAFGIMKAANDLGLKMPEDLAVIGYDDLEVSVLVNPPLSSVSQPTEKLGYTLIESIGEIIRNPSGNPVIRVFPPRLVTRGTG